MIYMCFDLTKVPAVMILGMPFKTLYEYIPAEQKLNENLLIEMEKFLVSNKMRLSDIEMCGFVNGPGSYTGIRISMTTIQAFDAVNRMKIMEINSFEPFLNLEKNCLALLKNTKTSYFFCKIRDNKPTKYGIISDEELNLINEKCYTIEEIKGYEDKFELLDNYDQRIDKLMRHKIAEQDYIFIEEMKAFYMDVDFRKRIYIPDEN